VPLLGDEAEASQELVGCGGGAQRSSMAGTRRWFPGGKTGLYADVLLLAQDPWRSCACVCVCCSKLKEWLTTLVTGGQVGS